MSAGRGLDLTGDWAGVYSYPHSLPPVSFAAHLTESAGWIAGVIEEQSEKRPPRRLRASIQGRRTGLSVTWLKTYDDMVDHNEAVQYEGAVTADGGEISGRWSLFGSWSGSFLMVRPTRTAARRARRARANLGA